MGGGGGGGGGAGGATAPPPTFKSRGAMPPYFYTSDTTDKCVICTDSSVVLYRHANSVGFCGTAPDPNAEA